MLNLMGVFLTKGNKLISVLLPSGEQATIHVCNITCTVEPLYNESLGP